MIRIGSDSGSKGWDVVSRHQVTEKSWAIIALAIALANTEKPEPDPPVEGYSYDVNGEGTAGVLTFYRRKG